MTGAAIAGLASLLGWHWPETLVGPYDAWNRVARYCSHGARLWLTGICFLMISVVGGVGSRMVLSRARPGGSGWIARPTLAAAVYRSQSNLAVRRPSDRSWIRSLASWSRTSDSLWVVALLPFLLALNAVQGEERASFGGDVYTLY